jgi:uncharacterized RDD family membrane protein YckC
LTDETPLSGVPAPEQPTSADASWAPATGGSSGPTLPPAGGSVFAAPVIATHATGLQLAGFWIRFAGLLVDGILFYVVNVILSTIFLSTTTTTVDGIAISTRTGPVALIEVILIALELGYVTYFWTTTGATLGQTLVGIKVVDATTGEILKPSQAVIRYVGMIISGIPLLLGYIWAAFDPKKQGWMDKIANTQVVKAR